MKNIMILDTSIGTLNLGDEIIVDSVNRELRKIFPGDMFLKIPTHEKIGRVGHARINLSEKAFVAGTNLLSSQNRLFRTNQWNINAIDSIKMDKENIILMGVGWQNYQDKPNLATKILYTNALSKGYIHSVRDNYTKEKLKSIGINNVYNTGCPTMWELNRKHCDKIPVKKSKNVVCTFTDYRPDIESDNLLISILEKNYDKIYCWIQGHKDLEYINKLSSKSLILINPNLKDYDNILDSDQELDYVGTRLHAGVRAMQKKRRSIIIGVDNRAIEKKKDFNLNVIERINLKNLDDYINSEFKTDIKLDFEVIDNWKKQFIDYKL